MKFTRLTVLAATTLFAQHLFSQQVDVDLELRPRAEYRHGFKTLAADGTDPTVFVSQRTQLNTNYSSEKLKLKLSLQDVRVWGDVPTLNTSDNLGTNLHEAWAELSLNPKLFLRAGRQEINLDDQRIFGSVNWVQQARSHDAAILKYKTEAFKLDVAVAYNQDKYEPANSIYGDENLAVANNYKTMQYVWMHKDWTKLKASFLFLNNGLQYIDAVNADNNETRFSQMAGTHLKYTSGKLGLTSNLYYQFGKDKANNNLSAYLLNLDVAYKLTQNITPTLGAELISGNENGAPSDGDNNAFMPLYGTNHKFNGLMDFFYVGNHGNNVGLFDLYLKTKLKFNEKSNLYVGIHNFSAAAKRTNIDKQLGNEIDLVYAHKLQKDVILKAGYSHFFAAEGMEALPNGNTSGATNNLGWVMLIIKPTLFKSTPKH
ncbi:MAG: alginate export family protein [Flavobacteriaceae bacterium]